MGAILVEKIIIKFLSGSKNNQILQIPINESAEITIGRDPTCNIPLDPVLDTIVSRKHARIIITKSNDDFRFNLIDDGSSNKTYLNSKIVATGQPNELFPDDIIELGRNGPKLSFSVEPRPENYLGRTTVIGLNEPAATRLVRVSDTNTTTNIAATNSVDLEKTATDIKGKRTVGKDTVQALIQDAVIKEAEDKNKTKKAFVTAATALVGFFVVGGALLYFNQEKALQTRDIEAKNNEIAINERLDNVADATNRKIGMQPIDIYNKFAKATVKITGFWRLYDKATGKPLQQKTVKVNGKLVPAYIRLPNNLGVVRWLTFEDDAVTNVRIGFPFNASGFVVDPQGYILTNKHVAAGWEVEYEAPDGAEGIVYDYIQPGLKNKKNKSKILNSRMINLESPEYSDVYKWKPESGGYVFDTNDPTRELTGNTPDPTTNTKASFTGRNEALEVTFHGSRLPINASLVRSSTDSDVSLIKVDSPQSLIKLDLAPDAPVKIGENVITLGFPAISADNRVQRNIEERGTIRTHTDVIAEATVTDGIVSKTATGIKNTDGGTFLSDIGEVIQLSITATGRGNSGGPVFNGEGKVIGIYTYTKNVGDTKASFAIPIKFGSYLLQTQN